MGITENDSIDARFHELKESFDRGEVERLAGLPLGAMRDAKGYYWDAEDAGLW